MIIIYVSHTGGVKMPITFLRKFFPGIAKIKKNGLRILGEISLNDMSFFTNYIETNPN